MEKSKNVGIRNIAIIAHVDHGKTTLVDGLLKQSGTFRTNQVVEDRVMDHNDIERERGITILSKNTAIDWNGTTINIVDTPGHADFGGEVERVLGMVDSTLLLVDASEGPMPQTRFVLGKSLEKGHCPVVVINKIDRPNSQPDRAIDEVFDLFVSLGATEEQLDFPIVYASARDGWAALDLADRATDLSPLLDLVVKEVPPPPCSSEGPLQLQVSTLDHDDFVGRIAIGRISRGVIEKGMRAVLMRRDGSRRNFRVSRLMGFRGLERVDLDQAVAGDIVAVSGVDDVNIGETICPEDAPEALPLIDIEEPTISMMMAASNGPFAGRDGKYVTSRQIRDRLYKECERNVSIRVNPTEHMDTYQVSGRGELQLAVLIETMRREGYEMQVSRPRPILRESPDGAVLEPIEDVVIEIPNEFQGAVLEKLGPRRAMVEDVEQMEQGHLRISATVPARGLIGFRNEFLTDTRGEGTLVRVFKGYEEWRGPIPGRRSGSLIAMENGTVTTYALINLQSRGSFFVAPGEPVYGGQIVGEHARPEDLVVNICRARHLTNHRQSTKEETVKLNAARSLVLDTALEFIADDELVEVTPNSLRLRKGVLEHQKRKRSEQE